MTMKILKNRSVSVIIAAVVCVITLLIGVHLSIGRQVKAIENSFFTGVEYDGYVHPSIADQLADRADAALGIISITSAYSSLSDETDSLRSAREALLSTDKDDFYGLYKANEELQKAYETLMSAIGSSAELDESSAPAMESYTGTMGGAQNLIRSSGYNNAVSEFERTVLRAFPVSILKYPAFAGSPEFFGAEG